MNNWIAKEEYPDLSAAKMIAIDVETKDPHLLTKGPGTFRQDGYICGFSIATDDGFKGYYPIRHEGGGNVSNPKNAIKWLSDQMHTPHIPKVGANILYDLEWLLGEHGITVLGKKYDVQIADPLLNENHQRYTLNRIAKTWLGVGKSEDGLFKAAEEFLKVKIPKDADDETLDKIMREKIKANIWKMPAKYVGEYGENDASLPIDIFKLQKTQLEKEDMWQLFQMECEVLELLLAMRFKGIPVDMDKAQKAREDVQKLYDNEMKQLRRRIGGNINVWANEEIATACDKLQLKYPRTTPTKLMLKKDPNHKGNPSFEAPWLEKQEHPVFQAILKARQYDRSGGTFIQSKIIDMAVNGRIYPSFWQVKNESGGTVSGRFSSSNPNAQQFPARNVELAKIVRGLLVAESGCRWGIFDYSQQEPRVLIHYAALLKLTGADAAMKKYIDNPKTDYHQMVADLTGHPRKLAKIINLALSYGMGVKKFAATYGFSINEAYDMFNQYHDKLPFIKELTEKSERLAKHRGYVKTLLGRHCRFNLYGPPVYEQGMRPLFLEDAIKKYGRPVTQWFTYRAMNRIVQGGSADMMKKAMVDCYKAGYVPNITVHDELDFADIENDKQIKEISEIMVNAIKLKVPIILDVELGSNWGNCVKGVV